MSKKIILTKEQENLFIQMNKNGESVPTISKKINISKDVLWRIAKEFNLNLKSKKMYKKRNSKFDYKKWDYKSSSKKRRCGYNKLLDLFSSRGDEILIDENEYNKIYKNEENQIPFKCKNGTINKIQTVRQYKQAKGCSCNKCLSFRISHNCSLSKRKSYLEMIQYCNERGWKLSLSEDEYYSKQNLNFISVICENNHKVLKSISNLSNGCPECNIKSYAQLEIVCFIKKNRPDVCIYENNRSIISPFELDIYIPDLNIAIEYCGEYWHSSINIEDRNYHFNKYKMCKEKEIRLITIFESNFINKKEIVLSRLLNLIGKIPKRIYGRNVICKKIDTKEANLFFENNHIQGTNKIANLIYGLYYKDELVSAMSFSKTNICKGYNNNNIWELNRFCSKVNTTVIGGVNKLFKNFLKDKNPKNIITYSDLRWGEGDIYLKLGFKNPKFTGVNYYYYEGGSVGKIKHRFSCRKNILYEKCKKLSIDIKSYNDETERSLAKKLNLHRVYDCGNLKYYWNIT